MPDGLTHWCRKCCRESSASTRKRNPEGERETQKRYKLKNLGMVRIWSSRAQQRREAREKEVFVEDVDLKVLYERAGGICVICEQPVDYEDATIEHFIPVSKGGLHAYSNCSIAHGWCNTLKRDNLPKGWWVVTMQR